MILWELDKWLTEEGDNVVRKASAAENGIDALDSRERLIYEMWVLDTESINGGLSQYFSNRGLDQWDKLSDIATGVLMSFAPFAVSVNRVIGRSADPYMAIIESDIDLDAHYNRFRPLLLAELKSASS